MNNKEILEEIIEAYNAGFSAAVTGPNLINCNFKLFSTEDKKDAWSDGYDKGIEIKNRK